MAADGPEELLVTIAPLAAREEAVEQQNAWLGPLLIVGLPVGLAFVIFFTLLLR